MTDTVLTGESISLFTNPRGMARQMLEIWSDPRQVAYRGALREQPENLAWLDGAVRHFGFALEGLPEIKDPVREAWDVPVRVLIHNVGENEQEVIDMLEDLISRHLERAPFVIDFQIGEPEAVQALDKSAYRPGDHFDNPLPQTAAEPV